MDNELTPEQDVEKILDYWGVDKKHNMVCELSGLIYSEKNEAKRLRGLLKKMFYELKYPIYRIESSTENALRVVAHDWQSYCKENKINQNEL